MNLFVQSSRSKQYAVDFLKMPSLKINKWIELPSFHGKPLLNSKGQKATSKTCHHFICPEVKGLMLSKPPQKNKGHESRKSIGNHREDEGYFSLETPSLLRIP